MRIRVSLRSFFLLLTLIACICYFCLARPTLLAHSLADAVNRGDYTAADRLLPGGEAFLANWADERWNFQVKSELLPLTLAQLLTARRHVDVHVTFFEFDSLAAQQARIVATPLSLNSPVLTSVTYYGTYIDAPHNFKSEVPTPRR